jgi:hypothetical protein
MIMDTQQLTPEALIGRVTREADYLIKHTQAKGFMVTQSGPANDPSEIASAQCPNGSIRFLVEGGDREAWLKSVFVFGRPNGIPIEELPTVTLVFRATDQTTQVLGDHPQARKLMAQIKQIMGIGLKGVDETDLHRSTARAIFADLTCRMKWKQTGPLGVASKTRVPKSRVPSPAVFPLAGHRSKPQG